MTGQAAVQMAERQRPRARLRHVLEMSALPKAQPKLAVRRHLRLQYTAPATLWVQGVKYEGRTDDVSEGGLQFHTEQSRSSDVDLTEWKVGRITFGLPHFPAPLEQDVRIAWIAGQGLLRIGCQFINPLPKVAIFVIHELKRRQLMGL